MKRILFFLSLLIVAIWSTAETADDNSLTYTVSYDSDNLTVTTVKARNGQEYCEVELEGSNLGQDYAPGSPNFPGQRLDFSVPFTATDFKLTLKVGDKEIVQLPYPPYPTQPDYFANEGYVYPDFIELIHPSDYRNPPIAKIVRDYEIGGICRVVYVNINPIRWGEYVDKITFLKQITIGITWTNDISLLEKIDRDYTLESVNWMIDITKETVVNPQDVVKNCVLSDTKMRSRVTSSLALPVSSDVPYVIVTSDDLKASMERLAALRRLRGIETKIESIEDILNDTDNAQGDEISHINDGAGKLRGFLMRAHKRNSTDHVLLAGRYPTIPGRWVQGTPLDPKVSKSYMTDQYYRDLSNAWPDHTSTSLGNIADVKDMRQDINVGRLSFSKADEVDAYIDKLIQYEFSVNNTNLAYLANAFVMLSDDQRFATAYNSYSSALYRSNFGNVVMDSVARTSMHTGAEVIRRMKEGNHGFFDLRGHGHHAGVIVHGTGSQQYGVNTLDSYRGVLVEEKWNGLDCYKNTGYPSWSLSMSCSLAELGYNRDGTYTFADSCTLGKDYGGVVFMGNSYESLIDATSLLCGKIFNEGARLYPSKSHPAYAGEVLTKGLRQYPATDKTKKYVASLMTLIGDPLVPLWFGTPYGSSRNGSFYPANLSLSDTIQVGTYDLLTDKATNKADVAGNHRTSGETLNSTKKRPMPFGIYVSRREGNKIGRKTCFVYLPTRFISDSKFYPSMKVLMDSSMVSRLLVLPLHTSSPPLNITHVG